MARHVEPRSVEQFLSQVDHYIRKKNAFIQGEKELKEQRALEGVTFKPQLDPHSQLLIAGRSDLNVSVEERLHRSHAQRQERE